jgi:hypothetical protein
MGGTYKTNTFCLSVSPTSSVYLYGLTYFLLLSSFSSFGTTGGYINYNYNYIVTFIMNKMKKLE